MDIDIYFLGIGIAGLTLTMTLLFVYFILQRMHEAFQHKKKRDYMKQNRNLLYDYIVEGEEPTTDLQFNTPLKKKALEEMLLRYAKSIRGEEITERTRVFAETYLTRDYQLRLQSRKWSVRLNVLHNLIDLRMGGLIVDILAMLHSSKRYSREEYLQMYRALVIFKHRQFNSFLLKPHIKLSEVDYKRLFMELDHSQCMMISTCFDTLAEPCQYAFVEIIGYKKVLQLLPFLDEKLEDESLELRVRVLKVLSQFGYVYNLEKLDRFVYSTNWEERLMVAKLYGQVYSDSSLSHLQTLLKDPSWWVRSQAARSIAQFKSGKEILTYILNHDSDSFARDMAREVLGKG